MIEVYDHAIDQYIERVLCLSLEDSTKFHRDHAEDEILRAVKKPDEVYHSKPEMPQIHMRNNAAVVTGVKTGEEGKLRPYKRQKEIDTVPTVYNTNTFKRGPNGENEEVEA